MKFSLFLTTARGINNLKQAFVVSSPDAEIIIIDKNYNEETKNELRQLKHDFCKVTYAPPRKVEDKLDEFSHYHYKVDRTRSQNTALAYVEAQWVYKLDDCTEICPDFFKIMEESISFLQKRQGSNKFVIRPIKLEEWNGHKKWEEYPLLKNRSERLFQIGREGIGGYFHTLDQFIFPIESMFLLNGIDERFDIGHGHEDRDMLQRYITLGYPIFLDKMLKTFQTGHRRMIDPIPFTRWLYEITLIEILNGRYRAYNPFDLKELREKMLKEKGKYVIKPEAIVSEPIATPILVDYAETVGHPIEEQKIRLPLYTSSPAYITGEYPVDKFFSEESLEENLRRIKALRNRHLGEDLFILGNSADLTKETVDKLRGKITFGANGILIAKDAWNYEPTYMVVDTPGVFDNHLRYIKPEFTVDGKSFEGSMSDLFFKTKKPFILSDALLKPLVLNLHCMRREKRAPFMEKHVHIRVLNESEFTPPVGLDLSYVPRVEDISFDLEKGTFLFGTVITDLMIPVAAWMGFKNIYMTAVSGGEAHFYDTCPRNFWEEEKQRKIYGLYGLFRKRLNEIGINLYNLDRPLTEEEVRKAEEESLRKPNPIDTWKHPIYPTRRILGKEPYLIEYKPIDEVVS